MKDDPDFNIHFVAAIESKPSLYDNTNINYTNRNVQEKAWEVVAKEFGEPVADCKERWKNIRGSYTRYLKYKYTPGRKKKKPYYLAKHMKFLRPYTKTRQPKTTVAAPVPTNDFEDGESESGNEEDDAVPTLHPKIEDFQQEYAVSSARPESQLPCNAEYSSSDSHQSTPTASGKESRQFRKNSHEALHEGVDKSTFEYLRSAALKNEERLLDPDVSFLMSVLPDMKKMNDRQRRRFKISILESAISILDENSNASIMETMDG